MSWVSNQLGSAFYLFFALQLFFFFFKIIWLLWLVDNVIIVLQWAWWTGLNCHSVRGWQLIILLAVWLHQWNTKLFRKLICHFVSNLMSSSGMLHFMVVWRINLKQWDLVWILCCCFDLSPSLNKWIYCKSDSSDIICPSRLYLELFFNHFWLVL